MGDIALKARRVLVVDDNRDAANSVATLLRLCGQTVQQAYDGYAALRIASHFKPEIVFIDLVMRAWTASRWRGNCASSSRPGIPGWWR